MDPHGPTWTQVFYTKQETHFWAQEMILTKIDDFIVFSVQKIITVPSFMKFGALRKFALTQANQQQVASRRPPVTPHDERMVPKCVQLKFNT